MNRGARGLSSFFFLSLAMCVSTVRLLATSS